MGNIYLAYLLLTCFSLIFQGSDKEKDGKLNSQEYFNGLLDLIKRYDDVYKFTRTDTSAEAPATKLFSQLDHSNNGYVHWIYLCFCKYRAEIICNFIYLFTVLRR